MNTDLVGAIHALRAAFLHWSNLGPNGRGRALDAFLAWHASDCPSAPLDEAARLWRVKLGRGGLARISSKAVPQ